MNEFGNPVDGGAKKMSLLWTIFWFVVMPPIGIYRIVQHLLSDKESEKASEHAKAPQYREKKKENGNSYFLPQQYDQPKKNNRAVHFSKDVDNGKAKQWDNGI